ncbi:hypothetical protein ACVWYF_002656 [Hymenobacter sp. UYAg731]
MKFSFLLFLCGWLLQLHTQAQTTVYGRVLDAKSGDVLAGATILQTGTSNGIASDTEGNFTLAIPAYSDSIALTFSSIGYSTQWRRVAPGSYTTIRLRQDNRLIECDLSISPRAEVGLASGVRYAPFGGILKLYGNRLVRLPLTAMVSYQTNFSRNHTFTASLELPPLWQRRFTILEALSYEQLQAVPANMRFSSYKMLVSVGSFRTICSLPSLVFLLGGGYAQHQSLPVADVASTTGFGYSFGLQTYYYTQPFRLAGTVQATRWPGYWQWQARLTHSFGRDFQFGVTCNQLQRYTEISVLLSHTFY